MLKIKRKFRFLTLVVLFLSLMLTVGCFGGGSKSAPATPTTPTVSYSGNIIADSVRYTPTKDGDIEVTWKTKTPTKSCAVLVADKFFADKYPLYGKSFSESITSGSLEHRVVINGVADKKVAFAFVDGAKDICDNKGLGFVHSPEKK